MPAQLILEFEGVTKKEYDAINAALGLDMQTGEGKWPEGLIAHTAGLADTGRFVVTEIWDDPEHQAQFMEGRLSAALLKGGITTAPAAMTWIELYSDHRPGG